MSNESTSRYTKPLAQQLEHTSQHNDTDSQFKKTVQTVGKPQATDHNIMDDYVKNPPQNLPGDPAGGDFTTGTGAEEPQSAPDTVTAKDPAEIQARIDKSS